MYKEIEGNLIALAKAGAFDVIAHGCNCFCTMGAGIAPQMAKAFECDKYTLESKAYGGDINKLGSIDYRIIGRGPLGDGECKLLSHDLTLETAPMRYSHSRFFFAVVNCYTQYGLRPDNGTPALDYNALSLCLKKMNHIFKGKRIGLPQIGCGLAGGDWGIVKELIKFQLKDCDVTVVIYDNT